MISIISKNKLVGIVLLILIAVCFACKKETLSIPISTTPTTPKDTLKIEIPETGILEIFEPSPFIEGKAFGTKTIGNGENGKFNANMQAVYQDSINHNLITCSFSTYLKESDDYFLREGIDIEDVPLKVGKYSINDTILISNNGKIASFYVRLRYDGDVIGALYKLNLNKKSEIEIISVDEKQQQIKGKFNAHFNVYGKAYSPSFPIRVSFTDVIFECKVK